MFRFTRGLSLLPVLVRLAVAVSLLPFAIDWRSPFLAAVRPWALAGLTVVPIILAIADARLMRASRARSPAIRMVSALSLLAAALALTLTLALEAQFRWARWQVLRADSGELAKLGRHLIVGYRDLAEIHALIRRRAVAGVFLAAHNVRGMSAPEVRLQVEAMQHIRRGLELPPLWIATDQEGGSVSRLSPPLSQLPSLSEIVEAHPDRAERLAAVRRFAIAQGRELAGLGVNLNFAPVVDLNYHLVNPDDRYTRIHQRRFPRMPAW